MEVRRRSHWPIIFLWAVASAGCGGGLTLAEKIARDDPSSLAIINDRAFTLQDFERAYTRSYIDLDTTQTDSIAAYRDFLERYVNFRLKVLGAIDAGYAEDPELATEVAGYRAALARPKLVNKEILLPLLTDFHTKMQEMVEASHLMIRMDEDAAPDDTMRAYSRVASLRDTLMKGVDFGDLAHNQSQDPSARNPTMRQGYRGYLGFFGPGQMIKSFEDQAYRTPVGEVSPVFRTRYGYHLLYVHSRQSTIPDIRVAHILVRPESAMPEDVAAAQAKIQGFKERLDTGTDFRSLAREGSEDRNSGPSGGDLGRLRYGDMRVDPAIVEAAFALEEVGDISGIVESSAGLHILMLVARDEIGSFEEEYDSIERIVSRLPRMRDAEARLAADARARFTTTLDTTRLSSFVAGLAPDSVAQHLVTITRTDSVASLPVATLADSVITLGELATFAGTNKTEIIRNMPTASEQAVEVADVYLNYAAVTLRALEMEKSDEDFARTMTEFREGLLLFALMEDSVWAVAAQDSALHQTHYSQHADRYHYPDRKRIIEFYSNSDSLLQDVVARIDSGMSWEEYDGYWTEDSTMVVRIDTAFVEGVTNSVYDRALGLAEGEHTASILYRRGHLVLLYDGVEPARPKSIDEARAEIINELQVLLEDRLLRRLRTKFRVVVYPERLQGVFAP